MCINGQDCGKSTPPLKGARILLMEPNMLVALDSQDALLEAGAGAVVVANSIAEVLGHLQAAGSFAAIICDVNLGRESGIALAQSLVATGIPLIVASGYTSHPSLPATLKSVPLVSKPYPLAELIEVVSRAAKLDPDAARIGPSQSCQGT